LALNNDFRANQLHHCRDGIND